MGRESGRRTPAGASLRTWDCAFWIASPATLRVDPSWRTSTSSAAASSRALRSFPRWRFSTSVRMYACSSVSSRTTAAISVLAEPFPGLEPTMAATSSPAAGHAPNDDRLQEAVLKETALRARRGRAAPRVGYVRSGESRRQPTWWTTRSSTAGTAAAATSKVGITGPTSGGRWHAHLGGERCIRVAIQPPGRHAGYVADRSQHARTVARGNGLGSPSSSGSRPDAAMHIVGRKPSTRAEPASATHCMSIGSAWTDEASGPFPDDQPVRAAENLDRSLAAGLLGRCPRVPGRRRRRRWRRRRAASPIARAGTGRTFATGGRPGPGPRSGHVCPAAPVRRRVARLSSIGRRRLSDA